ncbi:MAG: ATP-binding protein [Evtepia gabavorous]
MNILSNAIKYTPDGGRIVISAGADRERVWLEVADNGIGIPDGDRERIFERFYRVDERAPGSPAVRAWDSPLPRRSSASMRAASAWWSGPAPAPPCGWS